MNIPGLLPLSIDAATCSDSTDGGAGASAGLETGGGSTATAAIPNWFKQTNSNKFKRFPSRFGGAVPKTTLLVASNE